MHDESMSDQVTLRPVSDDDLPMLDALTQDPGQTGEFGWFGWFDRGRWRRGWDENGLIGPDGGTLIVARGDDRLGLVNWRRQQTTPASHCWEIGIALLPEARGQGHGTQAHRLLARYLFAHTTVHRILGRDRSGQRRRAEGPGKGRIHPGRRGAWRRVARRRLAGRGDLQPPAHRPARMTRPVPAHPVANPLHIKHT